MPAWLPVSWRRAESGGGMPVNRRRLRFMLYLAGYALLVTLCLTSLARQGDLSLGRKPWENLVKTLKEMARPSFLDLWLGNPRQEYKSEDGTVLRVEDRRAVEARFLRGLAQATWTTLQIATLGALLGALLALPLGLLTARNLAAPKAVALGCKLILDTARSIHTLVFGLLFVGIIGLGPTAGILAIAAHCSGTYGKLFAEAIESLDMAAVEAVRAVGATPMQVFFHGIWPAVLPQLVSSHLYVWEYTIRDSTILGLVGAGGLGLLISEAVALFQWGRLATILLVTVGLVVLFDSLSRKIRRELL